jgi:kynurenine formamidase
MDKLTKSLPHRALGEQLSNWGRWGDDDELGTLNFVTPAKRVQASQLVKTGKIFDLGMPFDVNGPQGGPSPDSSRFNPIHTMIETPLDTSESLDGIVGTDDMVTMVLQCATQWDSLAHIGYDGLFYNNTPVSTITTSMGATRNSFDKAISRLFSRGLLLDIARLKGVDRLGDSTEIGADDLTAAEKRQGVRAESGDVLLVRTGSYRWFLEGDHARFLGPSAGLGLSTLAWIHDREIAAVACDNWACEVMPSPLEGVGVPFHMAAIRDIGLTLGEMFNLEDIAADCDADGVWEFLFSGIGLKITGAVGSPVTPMAIK